MVRVYGESDDILVVEGSPIPAEEIDCYDEDVIVDFDDGTQIRAKYCKPIHGCGAWDIKVVKQGTAEQKMKECFDEDAEIFSDVFEIDAKYVSHKTVEHDLVVD